MPVYTCQCVACGEQTKVFRHMADHGKWPRHCRKKMRQVLTPNFGIIKDIEPYRAVAKDKDTGRVPVISSRAQHRDFLRRNGYEELGNEKPKAAGTPADKLDSPKQELLKAYKQATGKL